MKVPFQENATFPGNPGKQRDDLIIFAFLLGWTILNLLQATFCELANDEAYYWTWSLYPDWGYLEHPPMIAWWIHLTTQLIPGEAGVRLLPVLASSFSIWLMYKLLPHQKGPAFILLLCSLMLVHAGGFMAVPDAPLMLFTSIFFFGLQRFLKQDTWTNMLLLCIAVIGMLYSKYHAIPVLFLCILAVPDLLKNRKTWFIILLSALAFVPHLLWLFRDGWLGIEYALSGRFTGGWRISYPFEYILGQLILFGPGIIAVAIYLRTKRPEHNPFERSLWFVLIGIPVFFGIWSFIGRVEANWTASISFPLLYFAHKAMYQHAELKKWITRISIPFICIWMIMRLELVLGIFPPAIPFNKTHEFHGWKALASKVSVRSNGQPLMTGNYLLASKLWFYSGAQVIPHGAHRRPTQFQVWGMQENWNGRPVLLFSNDNYEQGDSIQIPTGEYNLFTEIPAYQYYGNLVPEVADIPTTFQAGDSLEISFTIPGSQSPEGLQIGYEFFQSGKPGPVHERYFAYDPDQEAPTIHLTFPDKPGDYSLFFRLAKPGEIKWKRSEEKRIKIRS